VNVPVICCRQRNVERQSSAVRNPSNGNLAPEDSIPRRTGSRAEVVPDTKQKVVACAINDWDFCFHVSRPGN
jgi:hypothetical protein